MDIRSVVNLPYPGSERELAPATAAPPASKPAAPGDVGRADSTPSTTEETDVYRAVERINASLPPASQGIEFSVDEDTDQVIVKVIDRETREVLRQMPTQEALDIAKALERTRGLLIRLEA
jgi:flagellar protein FlaG